MEDGIDFLHCLHDDMSVKIFMFLEDVSDFIHISCVSRSWRHFVIANGLSKQLCLRMFPQLSKVDHVTESGSCARQLSEAGPSNHMEWQNLEKEHRAYSFLAKGCTSFDVRDLVSGTICASSTDNFPEESIHNTLEPRDRIARRPSYWSSEGHKNPAAPESLIYKLVGNLCVINEISIQPFQAYFQWGLPIYSAKSVRFKMGHVKSPMDESMDEALKDSADDKFVWTYTSQEFPMAQENRLQKFKLPEPVLCVGGILMVELLGRVQIQEMDGLFYICVSHVQVVGRSLSPAFGVEILKPSDKFVLKAQSYSQPSPPEAASPVPNAYLHRRVRDLEQIVNILRGNAMDAAEYEWADEEEEEEDESDDEFVL